MTSRRNRRPTAARLPRNCHRAPALWERSTYYSTKRGGDGHIRGAGRTDRLGGRSVTQHRWATPTTTPAILLINRNAVVSVDRLAEAVFDGQPTAAAATTLRSYIARVRRVVDTDGGAPRVLTQPPGYMLRVADDAFDVARFEVMLTKARHVGSPTRQVPRR